MCDSATSAVYHYMFGQAICRRDGLRARLSGGREESALALFYDAVMMAVAVMKLKMILLVIMPDDDDSEANSRGKSLFR